MKEREGERIEKRRNRRIKHGEWQRHESRAMAFIEAIEGKGSRKKAKPERFALK